MFWLARSLKSEQFIQFGSDPIKLSLLLAQARLPSLPQPHCLFFPPSKPYNVFFQHTNLPNQLSLSMHPIHHAHRIRELLRGRGRIAGSLCFSIPRFLMGWWLCFHNIAFHTIMCPLTTPSHMQKVGFLVGVRNVVGRHETFLAPTKPVSFMIPRPRPDIVNPFETSPGRRRKNEPLE